MSTPKRGAVGEYRALRHLVQDRRVKSWGGDCYTGDGVRLIQPVAAALTDLIGQGLAVLCVPREDGSRRVTVTSRGYVRYGELRRYELMVLNARRGGDRCRLTW